jgi:hypothetical protein
LVGGPRPDSFDPASSTRERFAPARIFRNVTTLFLIRDADELLAVRFACSPVWETLAAVRTFVDDRARAYHEPWHRLVRQRMAQLELAPLFAVEPLSGYVPDFLTPPPRVPWPRLRDQLAEIRRTPADEVGHELELCRRTVSDERHRRWLERLLADPQTARDLLATRVHDAWSALVAPFWIRIRTLLARDVEEHSRTLAQRGLRNALDQLDPGSAGPSAACRSPIRGPANVASSEPQPRVRR